MHFLVFDSFAKAIRDLPVAAILKALELESKILEFDSENYRLYLLEEAYSIFCFRQFVRASKLGKTVARCKPLPAEHVQFYRETVVRLVQANELAKSALDQFEHTFSAAR